MNRRIFFRTFMAMFGLSFATLLVFSYFFNRQQELMVLQVMKAQARTVARSIALLSSDAMVTNDQGIILENNLNILQKSPNIRYIVVSPNNGETIVSTPRSWRVTKLPPSLKTMEEGQTRYTILNPSLIGGKEEVFHYLYPLDFNGFEWGWLHLGFSTSQIKQMRQAVFRQELIVAGFILLSTLLGAYIFSKWLTKPIIKLNEAAKSAAKGHLIAVKTERRDEIGELVGSFNTMIHNLQEKQRELHTTNRRLEEKVQLRTKELEELNAQLEERVRKEVAQSREKDQMLIQQSRLASMGEMIGNIAHQWRQPLNALGLVLQNIKIAYETERLDPDYLNRAIGKGMKLVDTMSHTIDDFRNFFKPNKAKERFDIDRSIHSALELVESSLKNHDIKVIRHTEPNLIALGFPSEFSQVLLNILANAKDALLDRNPSRKQIRIEAYRKGEEIVVSVEDNAGGVDEAIVEKIFDPYFTTKEEGRGTGLGLYMSKMIVERNMLGTIRVEQGKSGARFVIVVPAARMTT